MHLVSLIPPIPIPYHIQTAIMYFVAQMLGAFMGYGLLKALTPPEIFDPTNGTGPGLCSTVPHPALTEFQAVSIEFLATSVLVLLICGVWDPRNAKLQDSVPLRFGFAISAIGSVVVRLIATFVSNTDFNITIFGNIFTGAIHWC